MAKNWTPEQELIILEEVDGPERTFRLLVLVVTMCFSKPLAAGVGVGIVSPPPP